jgi:exopolysaccharide biosynthesis polyprenyl glycosylphosphotransferase
MLYKDVGSKSLIADIREPKAFRVGGWDKFYWLRLSLNVLLDSWAIAVAWKLANAVGTDVGDFYLLARDREEPGWLWLIILVNLVVLFSSGFYQSRSLLELWKTLSLAQVILLLVAYLIDPGLWVSRSVLIYAWLFTLILVTGERLVLFKAIALIKRRFRALRRKIILVGNPEDTSVTQRLIDKTSSFQIVDIIDLTGDKQSEDLGQIIDRAYRQKVDEVFICSWENIEDPIILFWELKSAGVNWRICPSQLKIPNRWSEIRMIDQLPTIKFNSAAIVGGDFWCKRIFDMTVSLILLAIISIPMLSIAILIKLDSPGNIFYKQTRVGLKGKHFKVWKFRTMVSNASQLQKQLEAQNEVKGGVLFKIKNDPRITRVGKFLRRYSLDELPQLINVLRGEMSLVGPRPLPVRDVEKFAPHHFLRQEVLPGITGLWQVSGRSNTDSEQVFDWDFAYIQNWSLALDCKILLKTVRVIFTSEGAY